MLRSLENLTLSGDCSVAPAQAPSSGQLRFFGNQVSQVPVQCATGAVRSQDPAKLSQVAFRQSYGRLTELAGHKTSTRAFLAGKTSTRAFLNERGKQIWNPGGLGSQEAPCNACVRTSHSCLPPAAAIAWRVSRAIRLGFEISPEPDGPAQSCQGKGKPAGPSCLLRINSFIDSSVYCGATNVLGLCIRAKKQ